METNFYHRMFDVAQKECGNCDIITRYDLQFNSLHRTYKARVWTVRGRIFDVIEDEYEHVKTFTIEKVSENENNWSYFS